MKNKLYINGFTLVEMLITLIVSSSLFLGMMQVCAMVVINLEHDTLEEDIQHYVSHVSEVIKDEMRDADSLNIDAFFGYEILRIYNKSNNNNYIEKTFRSDDRYGMMSDEQPISSSGFNIFNNDKYDIDLKFTPKEQILLNTSDSHLRNNYYELNFLINITSKNGYSYERTIDYTQNVFTQNNYILDKNKEL